MSKRLSSVKEMLGEIKEDSSVPKNVRGKVSEIIVNIGKDDCKFDIKISRLLSDLGDISEDPNLPSYTRDEILMTIGILSEIQ